MEVYDVIIIGAGIYGLSGALNEVFRKKKVLIIEKEKEVLSRASYINQARVHNGYHYPRSRATASNSSKYFERFYRDFQYAVNKEFKSVYAISKEDSLVTKEQFEEFCENVNIPCKKINSSTYFKDNTVSRAYETKEYVFDIEVIRKRYKELIAQKDNIKIKYNAYIEKVNIKNSNYIITLNNGEKITTECVINTTYACINQINEMFETPKYDIKYELCEVALGEANKALKDTAITIMDGPFFSTMPFGKTKFHSLTSVNHTPHTTCYENMPQFECQNMSMKCSKFKLENCNKCNHKPISKINDMQKLFEKYLKDEYEFKYEKSLFTIKPILLSSETDDSRPTIIKKHNENPTFISCFSGKFNTIYLLDEFLQENFNK